MKTAFTGIILLMMLIHFRGYAQNESGARKEKIIFVIDLTGRTVSSDIKNDFSALSGIELAEYCEKPGIQALMILNVDRSFQPNDQAIYHLFEKAGVSFKPVSHNLSSQLHQQFCE